MSEQTVIILSDPGTPGGPKTRDVKEIKKKSLILPQKSHIHQTMVTKEAIVNWDCLVAPARTNAPRPRKRIDEVKLKRAMMT